MAQSLYHIGAEFRRIASETPGVVAKSAKEHHAIVKAVKQHDSAKAAAAMRTHLASISRTTHEAMRLAR
jgi:GntR family transcriptional repressor for pyruvate dehydrogenase complex